MDRTKFVFGMFVLAVVLSLSVDANAQRRLISAREYTLPFLNPAAKYWEKSRRVETTDETLANGAVVKSLITVNEVLLPDHTRYYSKKMEGGVVSQFEQITIKYTQYTRNNKGPWAKVDMLGSGDGSGNSPGSRSSRICEQYSVEDVILNGKQVQLYEALVINSDTDELRFNESRRWFDLNGLPYREEVVNGKLSPREETSKRVTTHEYDPKDLKIEAPQMK